MVRPPGDLVAERQRHAPATERRCHRRRLSRRATLRGASRRRGRSRRPRRARLGALQLRDGRSRAGSRHRSTHRGQGRQCQRWLRNERRWRRHGGRRLHGRLGSARVGRRRCQRQADLGADRAGHRCGGRSRILRGRVERCAGRCRSGHARNQYRDRGRRIAEWLVGCLRRLDPGGNRHPRGDYRATVLHHRRRYGHDDADRRHGSRGRRFHG